MKLFLSLATTLLFSFSALALPSAPIELSLSPGSAQNQANQYYSYNFGTTWVRSPTYADFTLTNRGPQDLIIQRIAIGGLDFDAYYNCPQVLRPGIACKIRVRFNPWNEGFKTGTLYIETNEGLIRIDLSGWARRL